MSGIMGIFYPDQKHVQSDYLEKMLDVLAHRGQDRAELWYQKQVGLAHRMTCTTPESLSEMLPHCDYTTGMTITADARIDNRQELLDWLELAEPADQVSDSLLILRAYQKWGADCPQKLLGVFAFAIWDEPQQKLFCARDFFGIKPFYYHHSSKVFSFASEIKALFCVPEVPQQLNELMVGQYLISNLDDKEITFYQDILRLPPAHSLTVAANAITMQRYGSLDPNFELKLGSGKEYAEAYRELFKQAVASRLRSCAPVGSMLSGGLDSSSICSAARDLLQGSDRKLHTFSGIFPNLPEEDRKYADERFFMDAVLGSGDNFIPHQVHGDRLSPLYQQDKIFAHTDEPYMGPNYYLNWAIYERAQQQGVRVLLDGIDGDTTVSHGFECFPEFARQGKWLKIAKEARRYARRMRLYNADISAASVVWQYAILPHLPDFAGWWRKISGQNPWYEASVISPKFASGLNLAERVYQLDRSDVPRRTARQNHWHGMNVGIHAYTLELADKGNSAFGIEPRYPFFDRRLVEFCLSVPVKYKFCNGWTRYLARIGMAGVLPKEIQSRATKADVGRSFRRRLLDCESDALDNLVANSDSIAPYIDLLKLKNSYQKYKSNLASQDDIFCINTALNLSMWLRQFAKA